jgi:hypothetical protein
MASALFQKGQQLISLANPERSSLSTGFPNSGNPSPKY